MKKLLSAVTSILMTSSFVTSAFASSFNVSAAGGVSAVQPNVSMEEIIDGAANKNAVQNDFVVTGTKVTYEAGKKPVIDFKVESNGHLGAMMGFEIADLPAGIEATVDPFCYAFDDMPAWEQLGEQWATKCMDPASQDPRAFIDGESIVCLELTVPADIKDGTYDITFDYFHVCEQPHELKGPIIEFDAKVVPGQLIVGSGAQDPTNPPATNPPATNPPATNPPATNPPATNPPQSGNVQEDFVITGDKVTYKAGEAAVMNFTVQSNGHLGAMMGFEIADLPAGIKADVDPFCYAFDDMPAWEPLGEQWATKCMDPASQDPRAFTDGEAVVCLVLTVPADIKDGTYDITFDYFHVCEQPHELKGPIIEFDAKVIPGQLIVGNGNTDPTNPQPTDPKPTDPPQSGNVQEDFVITGEKVTYKAGEDTLMNFTVQSNGHLGAMMGFEIADLPAGIKADVDPFCYAFEDMPAWEPLGEQWATKCMDPASQDPRAFTDGEAVVCLMLTVPADIKPGTYDITFDYFHVCEQPHELKGPIIEFDAKVIPGQLIVGDTASNIPSDTKTPDDFLITGSTIEFTKGDDYTKNNVIKFTVDPGSHKGATLSMKVDTLPAGIKAEVDPACDAFSNGPLWDAMGDSYICHTRNDAQEPQSFIDGGVVAYLTLTIPQDIAAGEYEIDLANFHVIEQASENDGKIIEFDSKVVPGKLIIKEPGATTTKEPVKPITTTTKAPVADGEALWVIDTVHGTPGKPVEVPVFVSGNSSLEVAGATFEIAANGADFNKVSGSCAAYGNAAIVNNSATDEFAFAQAAGKGSAAADKAVIMTITYDVPANAKGTIPVEWANVIVSDTNGNLISEKVKVQNGAIIIDEEPTVAPADGEVLWVIDTVHGTAGKPVDVPVFVSGNSTLEVAGATFEIAANGADFNKVSGSCAAYGNAAIVNNSATNEFAFAQAAGQGSAAADKAVIMTITYDVPANAKGTIPVEWADVTVSDTNGNLITEKVKVQNGAIIIDEGPIVAPADGEVLWVIDTVYGTAGKPVEVPVFVSGNSTLEVAGATFEIAANGADFNKVSGSCAAYGNAAIVNNSATNEFAFAQAAGQGSAAADKAVIMTITYDVPADATGTIPVEWANVTVSDTNGNLITEKVKVQNGAIILTTPTTEAPAPGTTEPAPTTEAPAPGTTVPTTEVPAPGTTEPTPTNPPAADGEVVWVIDTVYGTAGQPVEVPVFVKGNSNLEVAGATFTVNANGVGFNKVSGNCAAYGNAAIVNNSATSEYAFAQAAGQGSAAADKAVIMTITYDVPADATGVIPVEWANVTVSDTNGNLITEKVKLENGAIILTTPTTEAPAPGTTEPAPTTAAPAPGTTEPAPTTAAPAPGTTEPAPTTEAPAPGTTEPAPTTAAPVPGTTEPAPTTAAPVPGTTEPAPTTEAPAPGTTEPAPTTAAPVPGTTEPAPTTETPAPGTTEPAPTTEAPAPGTTVPTTEVPAPGTTEPTPTNPPAADGEVVWVIDTVYGTAGQPVEVPVFVKGNSNLEVAGATFTVNANGVGFNKVSGNCAAYGNAAIVNNADTSEYAFAQAAGKGSAAADKAVIMTITFDVPADATGVIPVEWANVTVADTDGNLITEKVKLENGAIILTTPTTEAPAPGTTEPAPTTAAPAPGTTEPAPTTEAPAPGTTEPAPTTAAPVPGTTEPAPTTAAPVPGTTEPAPTTEAPAPGTTEPAPTTAAPVPGTTEPAPTTEAPAPGTTEPAPTTEAPAPGTTEPAPTTETPAPGTTEPAPTTAAPVPTTAAPTTAVPTPTTTAPVVQSGSIIWQGETVTAAPGEEVTLSFIVKDPNGANLEIGGANFMIDADGNVTLIGGTGSDAYGAELTQNPNTSEFAFASPKGTGTVGPDGSKVVTLTFKVPEDAKDGDSFNIGIGGLVVSDANGNIISDKVLVIDGTINVNAPVTTAPPVTTVTDPATTVTDPATTVTDPATTVTDPATTTTTDPGQVSPGTDITTTVSQNTIISGDENVPVTVVDGYFFSHDPRPFPVEMVTAKYVKDENGLADFDPSKITFEDTVNGGSTPMDAYRESQTDFTYKLNVFYDGKPLYLENGSRAVVTAYIGVKGDSDLNNKVDSSDATNVLAYYAIIQTGGVAEETRITPAENEIVNAHPELDVLGKFLVDVDLDCYSKNNWNLKHNRKIDSSDASWVLVFYANEMTGMAGQAYENWIATLGDSYRESFEDYSKNGTIIEAE